jgi:uncharacterized membrane protein
MLDPMYSVILYTYTVTLTNTRSHSYNTMCSAGSGGEVSGGGVLCGGGVGGGRGGGVDRHFILGSGGRQAH